MAQSKKEGVEEKKEKLWVCVLRDWEMWSLRALTIIVLEVENLRERVFLKLTELFMKVLVYFLDVKYETWELWHPHWSILL